ncbi:hypothetical protein Tco_0820326 [Tanacetum coccineum]|uniref:Uncharacterized protein n=1 Tax=Tanacetum coccineum TaxID=301880 RepID=A0ABQ5AC68_9ASTR
MLLIHKCNASRIIQHSAAKSEFEGLQIGTGAKGYREPVTCLPRLCYYLQLPVYTDTDLEAFWGADDEEVGYADGKNEDEEDEDEEEEHLAPTDSTIVIPVDEPVFPPEGT